MELSTTFKLSLYCVTALVGWILGAAEEGWIPYGSLPMVVVGYLWSEGALSRQRSQAGGMGDTLASILGFIAFMAASNEFFSENVEGRLLSGTHLVVYLTWIVLLQRKTNRRYWLLLALGVLQLAVASVLSSGRATIWFGICAIVYVFAMIWTLSVFSLYRAESRFSVQNTADADVGDRLRHSAGQSLALDSVCREPGTGWLSMQFSTGVAFTSLVGLIVSALFFVLIPRVWISAAGGAASNASSGASGRTVTGIGSEVRLGDMGKILESVEPALELRIFENQTQRPVSPLTYASQLGLSEPLLRGATLSTYEDRRWKEDVPRPDRWQHTELGRNLIRQEIRLEPIGTDVLFFMGRPVAITNQRGQLSGVYLQATNLAYRGRDFSAQGVIRYLVYSELPADVSPAVELVRVSAPVRHHYRTHGYLERNSAVPDGMKRLGELAQNIVREEQIRRGHRLKDLETVQAIESHLRDTGNYKYTLNLSIDDATIDPVEDFLFNRKAGHCEYFASALVLMVRSVGIPARLVTGFKGGEFRPDDNSLHVQLRHAHAWCEAWIEDRAWVTLDGTPSDERDASVEAVSAKQSVWHDMQSRLSAIWSENVVNISLETQEEVIYRPLRELTMHLAGTLRKLLVSPSDSFLAFVRALVDPRQWLSLGGLVALLLIVTIGWLTRRWLRAAFSFWRCLRIGQHETQPRRMVEFYERFSRLMQARGLARGPTQTQHEFSQQATTVFERDLHSAGLEHGPAEISELFYRVRFGDEALPSDEAQHVDELIAGLERALEVVERV